jgi:hypothetical protein
VGKDVQTSVNNGVQKAAPTDYPVVSEKGLQECGVNRSVNYFGLVLESYVTVETTMKGILSPSSPPYVHNRLRWERNSAVVVATGYGLYNRGV